MDEPGGLRALGETGRAALDDAVARCVRAVVPDAAHPFLLPAADRRTPLITGPDWTGLPPRVVGCLSGRAVRTARPDETAERQPRF